MVRINIQKSFDKSVAFLTLGCKVNSYETDAMEQLFREAGYRIMKFSEQASVYIINTCTVTNIADRKSRQMIHRAKKNNPDGIVVAVGCYVQAAKEVLEADEMIDIVIGNNQKSQIVSAVEQYISEQDLVELIEDIHQDREYEELSIASAGEKTRAYIKIQDGCNQFCSYCIIPYVRGRIRSRKLEDIVEETKRLVLAGYQEVVLTGIHLSSYGVDFLENTDFVEQKGKSLLELIEAISEINGLERIRLGSLEPRIISNEFAERLSKCQKFCPHFHLSLQSGCNQTLKRMNRKYSTEEYFEKCQILRTYFDKPAITTDIIVGFPGETEEEFKETEGYLKQIGFSQVHIFKYSQRKGTKAEALPDQVSEPVKAKRSNQLIGLCEAMGKEYRNSFLGSRQNVLFEEQITIEEQPYYLGHNERYVKIAVPVREENENLENKICSVEVLGELSDDILTAH